jgi:hypothetical protein
VGHVKKLHALLAAYVGEVFGVILGEGEDGDASATAADLVRPMGAERSAG